jgi:magnesium chelatase family protein
MLVAAMNPCPCGYFSDPNKTCKCHPQQIDRYLSRISGPLIDRIDIHIEVPVVPYRELRSSQDGTSSTDMRQKVLDARERQRRRFDSKKLMLNNQMTGREIRKHCKLDADCEGLLRQAMTQLGLSARAHDKILRVSRTIADLDASEPIQPQHITEAIHYRRLDRQL